VKICTRCHEAQPLGAFYRNTGQASGLNPRCKVCVRATQRERRAAGLVQAAERRRYQTSPQHRAKVAAQTRKWKARNPEKVEAENIVAAAIKHGALTRQPCEVDGCATKAHAHHADYAEALEVRWLCPLHHARQHVAEGRLDHLRVAS